MGSAYSHLSLSERREIEEMLNAGLPVTRIAAALGRHRSTVHREVGRNFHHTAFRDRFGNGYRGYYGVAAHRMAWHRRHSGAKLSRNPALLAHVLGRLRAGWLPEQIAGRLKLEPAEVGRVSHETIYQHVYSPEGRRAGLFALLASARRWRRQRQRRKARQGSIPPEHWIGARPAKAADRAEFGHWEADLAIFARWLGRANVTSLLERQSRYLVLLANEDRRSSRVAARIGAVLDSPACCCPAHHHRQLWHGVYGVAGAAGAGLLL